MKPWTSTILVVFAMTNLPSHAQNSPKDYVDAHNTARSEVGVGPIEWNSTLESYAVNYANQRAGDCQIIHSKGPYGENIYTGYGQGYSDGVDAVRYWYNEKPFHSTTTSGTSAWAAWTACTTRRWCGATPCGLAVQGWSATALEDNTSSHATTILLEIFWGRDLTRSIGDLIFC